MMVSLQHDQLRLRHGGRVATNPYTVLVVVAIYTSVVTWKTTDGASLCTCDTVYNPTPGCNLAYIRQGNHEWSGNEIVKENGEKSLMCEVENFCDLQWFNQDTGQQIVSEPGYIEFEDNNQRLVVKKSRVGVDDGLYRCVASQGAQVLEPRIINLHIIPEDAGMVAILSHQNCTAEMADVGDSAMYYCEFSTTEKPFALDTSWALYNATSDLYNLVCYLNHKHKDNPEVTTRYDPIVSVDVNNAIEIDGFWIYNSTLLIHNISTEAFGNYRIKVTVNLDGSDSHNLSLAENPKPPVDKSYGLYGVGATITVFLCVAGVLGIVYHNNSLEMRLYWKDHHSKDCKNDGKYSDVYISYSHADESGKDVTFVINVLKVELEKRGYVVIIRDIDHLLGTGIHDEIVKSLETCRRCIMVVSPAYLTSWVGDFDIHVAMDRMGSNYKRHLIPVVYRDISNGLKAENQNTLLKHILDNVPCLTWPSNDDAKESAQSGEANSNNTSSQWNGTSDAHVINTTVSSTNFESSNNNDVNEGKKTFAKRKDMFVKELLLRMPPRRFTAHARSDDNVRCVGMITPGTRTSQIELETRGEPPSQTTPPTTL